MRTRARQLRPPARGPAVAATLAVALVAGGGVGAQDPGGPSAGDPEALAILEDAAERYAALEGFCADFHQVRSIPAMGREVESAGRLCQMDPGYFRMDFQNPEHEGDRIVADGEYVWVYYPSSDPGQVIRQRPAAGERRFDFHAELLSDPGERYEPTLEGRDEVDGWPVHVLELVPTERAHFVRARLWVDVDEGLVRKAELEEEDQRLRVVELSDLRLDPEMGPEDFAFEVPERAQVIDR